MNEEKDRNINPIYNPETGEPEVAWKEQPELIAEVKEKVAEVLHGGVERQRITTIDAIKYLKKNIGAELAALICSVELKSFTKFGSGKMQPTALQARNIAASYVIVDILLSSVPKDRAKNWLVEYSDYLYGIPAVEMSRRPEDVRMAALYLISSGGNSIA